MPDRGFAAASSNRSRREQLNMWGKIIVPLLGIAMISTNVQALQGKPQGYAIKGRVVDDKGVPLPFAVVVLVPKTSETNWESIIEYHRADANGRFHIAESAPAPVPEQTLYVVGPESSNAATPISPPFAGLARSNPIFAGRKVLISKNQETDLGDVLLQVKYQIVHIQVQDPRGALLWSNSAKKDQAMMLRVRDIKGDVISEHWISEQAIDIVNSLVTVVLPEGEWRLEVGLDKSDTITWHKLQSSIVVSAKGPPLEVALPVRRDNEVASERHATHPYEPGEALRKLQGLDIEFSPEAFVERVERNNAEAVALFLTAGMDPNAKGRVGNTALMEAAGMGFADIARLLLANGADVNARNNHDMTVLMVASSTSNSAIVKLLLDRGARVNERTTKGTALTMAVINDNRRNVNLLLAAGADLNVKGSEGKSAMTLASELGRLEIIEALRKYGAK